MVRFHVLEQLAFFPLTSPTFRSSATTTATAATALSRRRFFHVASTCLFCATAIAPGFASSTTTARTMASPPSSFPNSSFRTGEIDVGFLDAASASSLDEDLMQSPGFTLEQLMELAGLSVAEAAYRMIADQPEKTQILVVCGPGNNGGDGLVAARHLYHFGYDVVVVYPKRSSKQPHYENLVKQCEDLDIQILDTMPEDLTAFGLVLDSIFGFSFKGEPREPFDSILKSMRDMQHTEGCQILSVDVPSGWNVDEGDVTRSGFVPDAVISLTAPKACMRTYPGRHFVGGRFLPSALAEKYQVRMPPYPGVSQVMQISRGGGGGVAGGGDMAAAPPTDAVERDGSWETGYAAFCAEREAKVTQIGDDAGSSSSPPPPPSPSPSSWEAQYAAYCAEQEARQAGEDEAMKKS